MFVNMLLILGKSLHSCRRLQFFRTVSQDETLVSRDETLVLQEETPLLRRDSRLGRGRKLTLSGTVPLVVQYL